MKSKRRWSAFWSKVGAVSIRTKIMGIVAACIIGSALALTWYTHQDDLARAREELQKRGITIGNSLAAQSRDLILTDNQFALYKLLKDTSKADEDIIYIFLLDASGNLLVHTFDEGFPIDLLDKNRVPAGQPYRIQALQTEKTIIQDMAVSVLGGKAGVIRLGMSEATLRAEVAEHVQRILVWVLLVLVSGLAIAYVWASVLTKPVAELSKATQALGSGDFRWKAPVWAKDEIGNLGIAFNEMSKELKRKEQMREQLLAKVISAQEEERKRIARELHDETGQALTSLMVGLKYVEDSPDASLIKEKTAELRALAGQTLDGVHHMAMELRPSLLDDLGLFAAIQRYTKEYSAKMNINVDSHISGFNGQRLPPDIEVAVYRIIQEALTNIAKHANANNVSVILSCRDSSLMAVIEDDGKGFDINSVMASANEKNLGIFGMYERASLIGGSLTIESKSEDGTTIFLEVPLEPT